ncbi:translation repressor RelE [Desulfosarcina widdelii]|uniref:Translation repressor RelE n=1 Tax=Desulfosarcina widdelii TaxID=947919 RepID=A0A5K7YY50_9BACT|nr:type II toxin-antitoxin system RelE/ParE family toxin [Desulfosarcina widdelii]BBO72949.1 translation repressor RelE [Desulfosarcina widdelii]
MIWSILYHHDIEGDLDSIGPSAARRIVKAIDSKLTRHPMDFGAPLSGNLADFRKLRVGDYRVVYKVHEKTVVVYVLAVGPRRDKEIYRLAVKRK